MSDTTSSSIPSKEQYEQSELQRAYREIADVASAPLTVRKEAQAQWAEALKEPLLVANRIAWLIDGNYGKGSQLIAEAILGSPRMNRVAALAQLIASFEWQCDRDRARLAWKALTRTQQHAVNTEIEKQIKLWEESRND